MKNRKRKQHVGVNLSINLVKDMVKWVGKDPQDYAEKYFRESACAQLVETGISVTSLSIEEN